MTPNTPDALRATLNRLNQLRTQYQAAVRGGYVAHEVMLDPDHYAQPGYYELGPDEQDIADAGLKTLTALGSRLDARVTAVDRRPCVDPTTGTSSTFLTLHLTDGWSFVPAIPTLEEMWEWLGADEASYVGLRLTLTIAR